MIVSSAIKVIQDGKAPILVEGLRHCNCFDKIHDMGINRPFEEIQGFLTDNGVFMDRETAFMYAMIAKQIVYPIKFGTLYSEDLW